MPLRGLIQMLGAISVVLLMKEEKTNPTAKWMTVVCLIVLAMIPLVNMVVNGYNNLNVDFSERMSLEKLGQLGDFFGGHTAAFAGLLSTVLILYFSSKQLSLQRTQFMEQVKLSKQAADLSSLNNIYQHYGETYSAEKDAGGVLKSVADGHRRWVIRESFSVIDPDGALEAHRIKQVAEAHKELIDLLRSERLSEDDIRKTAMLVSSLLLDKRLGKDARAKLWEIYEIIRANPLSLITEGTAVRDNFEVARRKFHL